MSRGARRREAGRCPRQAGSILQLAARFLNSHLETRQRLWGQEPLSLLLVGSVYSPSRLGLAAPWPLRPTGQGLWAESHFQTLLHQQG